MKGFLITRLAHQGGELERSSVRRLGRIMVRWWFAGFGVTILKHFDTLTPKMLLRSAPEAENTFKSDKTFNHENRSLEQGKTVAGESRSTAEEPGTQQGRPGAGSSSPGAAQEQPRSSGAPLGEPRASQDTSTLTLFLGRLVCRFSLANLVSQARGYPK